MKTLIGGCLAVVLCLSCYGALFAGSDEGPPTLTVSGPDTLDKNAAVSISGTGFTPGQEIVLLFTAEDGMQSDIGYAFKEAPKADENGSFRLTWKCWDFIQRKMVKAGKSYRLAATDPAYLPLAQTTVTFTQ